MGVPNLTRVDARSRAELLSVAGYEVELDLTDGGGKPGERTFRSRTTVRFTRTGTVNFVDNQVDAATGTLRYRVAIENSARFLSPGLFVRLRFPTLREISSRDSMLALRTSERRSCLFKS